MKQTSIDMLRFLFEKGMTFIFDGHKIKVHVFFKIKLRYE